MNRKKYTRQSNEKKKEEKLLTESDNTECHCAV